MQKSNLLISKVLPALGIILSLYALYVEKRHAEEEQNLHNVGEEQTLFVEEKFQALCDIEAIGASCRCGVIIFIH